MSNRRTEGSVQWRSTECRRPGHRHSGCAFRLRVTDGRAGFLFETGRGNQRDADAALRSLLSKRDNGTAVRPKQITVGDWLTGFLARHAAEGHIGERATVRNAGIIRKHLVPGIGNYRLQDLRADHIDTLKSQWLSGEAQTAAKPLSGATVHKHLVILRQALDEALRVGLIARNPMDAVTAPSVQSATERRALDDTEITALLDAAAGTRFDAPIRFTLATAVREGELLGLQWDDFDAEARTVSIQRSLIYVGGEVRMKPSPKTARSRRTIELSPSTVSMLQAHRSQQISKRLRKIDGDVDIAVVWSEHGLMFPSSIGTPWIPRTFCRDFRAVAGTSGIAHPETVTYHVLRHTAASQWIRHGIDIYTVSRRLGHSSAAFTMDRYAHLLRGQQTAAAAALDYLLAQH